MVIAYISGGLGNQLCTYAWGYSVSKYLGQELVLDVSDYTQKGYFRPYCLDKLQIPQHQKLIYPPASAGFMDESCIPKEILDNGIKVITQENCRTREELLSAVKGARDVYLMGYGGPHYCTEDERREFRQCFQPKEPSVALEQFKRRTSKEFSVAVHLRRTDFVDLGLQTSAAYYQAAITYVKLFYPDAHFYFFSDDIQYAKEQFGACRNYHYVHLLGGMDADLDEFFCMSACNGRILSKQSSFSFWAAELNQSGNRMNLCPECDNTEGFPSNQINQIYLNQVAIDSLSGQYRAEKSPLQTSMPPVNDIVFQLLSEERNDEAISKIEDACLGSYGLSESAERELTTFKAIALAQKGGVRLPAALRTFYMQMQSENKDPTFHANYFRALYQAGCIEESAIHAALANRYGDPEDYQEHFAQMEPFVQKLYQLLRNRLEKQFVFIAIEGWNYYTTYIKTLAVLLARMGQRVIFLQPVNGVAEGDLSDEALASYAIQRMGSAGSVYSYHVDLIACISKRIGGERKYLFHELVSQCSKRFNLPTVVVASRPEVFSESKVAGVKYITPDIYDPLNRERFVLESSGIGIEDYVRYMAGNSDAIFLSGTALDAARKEFGSKVHLAAPAWNGPACQITDMELDFTPNFVSSPQMIQNALALLEA